MSQNGFIFPNFRGENIKYLKPPPRDSRRVEMAVDPTPPQQGPKAFCQFLLDTMLRQVAHGRILEDSERDFPEKNRAICWGM